MARRLIVHVGLMKSGTTFLQQVMTGQADVLAGHGVLFPTPWFRQVRAVEEMNGAAPARPAWDRLMAEIDAWPATAVISMEFLGPRPRAKVEEIVAALPADEVVVVVTARDLGRTIPAMWQEHMQNGGTRTWQEYVDGVREENRRRRGPGASFWLRQDVSGIVRTWSDVVGRDALRLVTVPPPGAAPSVLWDRFAGIVGIDADIDLSVPGNPSLGLASALLLRQINERVEALGDSFARQDYQVVVKRILAKDHLAQRDEPRLGFDAAWVRDRARIEIDRLRAIDPIVVGDLEELRAVSVQGIQPAQVPVEEQLDVALDALTMLVQRQADNEAERRERRRRQRRQERQLQRGQQDPSASGE